MTDMTHYMELLATNQPWNLILFMAVPVVLAETLAVSELFILLKQKKADSNATSLATLKKINKISGTLAGLAFAIIIPYLLITAVIPLTTGNGWRGFADIIAVGSYLLGGLPLIIIALQDLGIIHKYDDEDKKQVIHVVALASFLVLAHIAMIFGMLSPSVTGYKMPANMDHSTMTQSSSQMMDSNSSTMPNN